MVDIAVCLLKLSRLCAYGYGHAFFTCMTVCRDPLSCLWLFCDVAASLLCRFSDAATLRLGLGFVLDLAGLLLLLHAMQLRIHYAHRLDAPRVLERAAPLMGATPILTR